MEIIPEERLQEWVFVLVRLVEAAAALVIFFGAAVGFTRFVVALVRRDPSAFGAVRIDLGRFLALGLELQLASDLLRTAVAPSFDAIGKLAAVAAIRTALNFFLAREIRSDEKELEERSASKPASGA